MDESEELELIPVIYEDGPLGQKKAKELPPVKIFCRESSISRSEWETAARSGLKAEYQLTVCAFEYGGEERCNYKGKKYQIYRTYDLPNSDDVELYLGRKVGV